MKAVLLSLIVASTLIQDSNARGHREAIQLDGKTYYRIGRGRYVSSEKKRDEYFRAEARAIEKVMKESNREYDEYLKKNGIPKDHRYQLANTPVKMQPEKGFWVKLLEFILNPF